MHFELIAADTLGPLWDALLGWLSGVVSFIKVLIGFSVIIFVHELGHFLAAKHMGVRVDRFAVGFFTRLFGYRRGEGITFGPRPEYTPEQLAAKGYGETDYCLNILPFGGYVKMLGEHDLQMDEKTGRVLPSADPRAFTNKPVWKRMVVVSAGVVFNVIFALLLYVVVFTWLGKSVVPPVIGMTDPEGPFAKAGLLPGDRLISADGRTLRSFEDLAAAWIMADDKLALRVERDGTLLPQVFTLAVDRSGGALAGLGVSPPLQLTLGGDRPASADPDGPQPGDRIISANGIEVQSLNDLLAAFLTSDGRDVTLHVRRELPRQPPRDLTFTQRPMLMLSSTEVEGSDVAVIRSQHLLGLVPRPMLRTVVPGDPADRSGLRVGDVVVQWGNLVNPTDAEIRESLQSHESGTVRVVVERDGQRVEFSVEPRRPFSLTTPGRPRVGVDFTPETRRLIVADIAARTPAARIGLPRGAELLALDDEPLTDWCDLVVRLRRAAGRSVSLRYRSGGEEAVARLDVPASVVSELGLGPTAAIRRIDGEDAVRLASGRSLALPSPYAVRELLRERIGRTVTIEYAPDATRAGTETAEFHVREDNFDPWQLRIAFGPGPFVFKTLKEPLHTGGNPIAALVLGVQYTWRELTHVYLAMQAMASRKVGVDSVAGPIGIFSIAQEQAAAGWGDLLFFLAFISVNLAVLNFLPLPVVDGGLMVFLILEAIRGKPVSIKVQVITTLTGLALIAIVFVFVTVQDIGRLLGG